MKQNRARKLKRSAVFSERIGRGADSVLASRESDQLLAYLCDSPLSGEIVFLRAKIWRDALAAPFI